MLFKPNKHRFLILAGTVLVLLSLMVRQALNTPGLWLQTGILVLIFSVLVLWLAFFEIHIDGDRTTYRSLFGGTVQFGTDDIKNIKINRYDELTHLLHSKHTLFIDLKSGRRVMINTRIFPPKVAELLAERGWPVRK